MRLILIEDDRADALLVEELIVDIDATIELIWVRSIAEAEQEFTGRRPDCVLLDLHLPDANGIDALRRITDFDDSFPVVVLTGLSDKHVGVSAVGAGAQDYLIKGRVEPETLRRALLYAVERKRAELASAMLHEDRLRAEENARLERGLLPSPSLLEKSGVEVVTRYQPSRERGLLGGDFYDVVQTPDRIVHAVIGDVCGHGPEAAALGVALRIAWRALTLAGIDGVDKMRQLDRLLRMEGTSLTFATVLSVAVDPSTGRTRVRRAGHPAMLLRAGHSVEWIETPGGRPLGLMSRDWPEHEFELPVGAGLVLLTDGLFEGHSGQGNSRLGEDGLLMLARSVARLPGRRFVTALIEGAQDRARLRGGLADDVAIVQIERTTR